MPGLDGTGPMGMGPMTGGGRGFCSPWGIRARWPNHWAHVRGGYGYPYAYPARRFGLGYLTRDQEVDYLKSEAEALKRALDEIEARISELSETTK